MKKTILYLITQSELGGAQTYIFDLAKNLKNEFNIIVAFGEQGDDGWLAKALKQENIKYYTIPHLKRSISPINDLRALFKIKKLIRILKPNIIHLNSSKISILGSLATIYASRSTIKVIYTAHGWVFNEPMSNWKKSFYKFAEKFTAKLKNKIICVSKFDRQVALKEKVAPKEKLITIHNGIKKINFLGRKEAIKKIIKKGDWGFEINENNIIIGSIGNLYKTKGFKYLIEATKILLTKGLNIKIIIMGKTGEERKKLTKLINKYNLKDKIILTKPNSPSELLKTFDIYICSSVKEGLSYTIIEAMQAGLPIIVTKVGGNPELIKNNKNGLLVEPKNPEQIAEAVNKFINDNELVKKFGEESKKIAETEFTLEKMLEKTKKLYK